MLRPLADDLSVHTQILLLCELYLESARHDQRCPFYPLCVLADSRCGIDSLRRGDGQWATIAAMANNALSFYLIFELIKRAGPVFFSMVNYVATLTGMGLGIWLFSDAHSVWIWAALVLIGASLVLVNFISMRSR